MRTSSPPEDDGVPREYRITELAALAGLPVRTVRFYRERGLLAHPRRQGRVVVYTHRHLERLRAIKALLERGHTLNGIAHLTLAYKSGVSIGELLGELPGPSETPPADSTPSGPMGDQ
ncbi:MerR family transcriptional regulator [Streptomyces sp. NPDC054919]